MKKEVIVFLVTLAVLAGLYFLSGEDEASAPGRGGRARGTDPQAPLEAKRVPGRFIPDSEVTWAANASNIFETPSETRDLPPLDVAPPPLPRLVHPGPTLPIPLNIKARSLLRRTIVPSAQPAGSSGAAASNAGTSSSAPPAGTTTNPTPAAGPLIPLDKPLSSTDRIKLSLDQEKEREAALAKARQSEEDRKATLDKLTITDQTVYYGEMVPTEKGENRYKTKSLLDQLRTDPALTEPERNEKLKKFRLSFREDKRGKLGKPVLWTGDVVQSVTFADTPENRYRMALLVKDPKDLGQQLELAKIVFDARLFKLAAEHLSTMKKANLTSAEMLTMLADSQHELYDYNHELEVLRQATKDFPDSAPLLGRLGRLQVMLGMIEDARASFNSALAKNGNDALANAGLADVKLRTGDPKGAVANLRDALNAGGSDPVKVDAIRNLLAEAYLAQGDFKNAQETLDLVLGRTSNAPERARVFERASVLSAVAALGQGNVVEARTRVDEGVKRYPLSGQLSLLLGIVMVQQGDLAGARARIQNAIELDPLLTGHAQVALAIVDEASADDAAAVSDAEAGALTANPGAPELRLNFGRALLHVGDLARARAELQVALDWEPRSVDILTALGDVEYADGHLLEAIRYYDRAAALEPGFPQLLARRLITQVRRRKLSEAEDIAKAGGTTDLKDPFFQAANAYFQYTKGNQAEALHLLQKLGEGDAATLAAYAKDVHAKLMAHQNKEMWTESFTRTGTQPGRGWNREIGAGVNVGLKGQAVVFDGKQTTVSDQPTMIWQERTGDKIYGFSADLDLPVQPGTYAGIGLMVMNQTAKPEKWPGLPDRKGGLAPYTGLQVALSPDGKLVYRVLVKGHMGEWDAVPITTFAGGPVTLELQVDSKDGVVSVLVNRDLVLKQTLNDLKRFRRTVELQIFCQAQVGRPVHFAADNVVIVTLKDPK